MKIMQNYYKPTPKKWRKIGDALLGIAAYGELHAQMISPAVGSILIYLGIIGKFVTNLFAEE